jgi:hypothetical protein
MRTSQQLHLVVRFLPACDAFQCAHPAPHNHPPTWTPFFVSRVVPAAQGLRIKLLRLQQDGDPLGVLDLANQVGTVMNDLQRTSVTLSGSLCASADLNGTLVPSLRSLVREVRTTLPQLSSGVFASSDRALASLDTELQVCLCAAYCAGGGRAGNKSLLCVGQWCNHEHTRADVCAVSQNVLALVENTFDSLLTAIDGAARNISSSLQAVERPLMNTVAATVASLTGVAQRELALFGNVTGSAVLAVSEAGEEVLGFIGNFTAAFTDKVLYIASKLPFCCFPPFPRGRPCLWRSLTFTSSPFVGALNGVLRVVCLTFVLKPPTHPPIPFRCWMDLRRSLRA